MKDILMVTHFTQVPGEKGNGRFHYLAEKIDKSKASVEIVTTSFSHRTKRQREVTEEQLKDVNYKLTMLYEPGYKKNVSLKRFYSHYIMGKSLKKYLGLRKTPDVIYCAVPSLDVGETVAKYAKENNIKFIIDIQDLWPEAFKMVFNIPVFSNIAFLPMQKKADFIYSMADEVMGVSESYVERGLRVNKKCNNGNAIYLGTELSYVDNLLSINEISIKKPEDEIWLGYIGTLGHSYDIVTVIDALKILKDQGVTSIKFVVMGDGPLRERFETYAKNSGVNTDFTGRLDYEKMIKKLKYCDLVVNPIKKGSAGSIINKVGDYAAVGLPVLNTQECKEYRKLIDGYNCGFNIKNEDSVDLAKKIKILFYDRNLREKMGTNNRKLAMDKFDRNRTYNRIISKII